MTKDFVRSPDDLRRDPSQAARNLSLSVVIPHYDQPEELAVTLAGLDCQTGVDPSRVQVVVVDDGSAHQPSVAPTALDVQVVGQERQGFGLARARNLGASRAEGEVLVFLDADMLPAPDFLARHVSWHGRVDHVVAVGGRRHVELDSGLDPTVVAQRLVDHVASGTAPPWQALETLTWRDELVGRLRANRRDPGDVVHACSGGNLSIPRDFYREVGGTNEEFTSWGGEDVEAAHRYRQGGGLIVFDDDALAYHQGLGAGPSSTERAAQRSKERLMRRLVPLSSVRGASMDRRHEVPRLAILVPSSVADAGPLLDRLLGSGLRDVAVFRTASEESVVAAESLGDPLVEWVPDDSVGLRRVLAVGAPHAAVLRGEVESQTLADALSAAVQDGRATAALWQFDPAGASFLFDVGLANRAVRGVDIALDLDVLDELGRLAGVVEAAAATGHAGTSADRDLSEVDQLADIYWALPPGMRRAVRRAARLVGRTVRRRR